MRRRRLLALTPAAAIALAGCAGGAPGAPSAQNVAVAIQDVGLIATGLGNALPQLAALNVPGLTPQVLATCKTALLGIQACAQAIKGATTPEAAQPTVAQVETYLNAIVGALAGLPLPPPINTALLAATILLPLIEAAVNMAVPPSTTLPAPAATPAMTPDQARGVLNATS